MKTMVSIKDHKIVSDLNLDDGVYNISIHKRCDDKTYNQVKKLWATIDDISMKLYGDKSQSQLIYLQILHMAGRRTEKLIIEDDAIPALRRMVKSIAIVQRDVVNGKPMCVVDVCLEGISEMSRSEVASVIDSCIKYAIESGVDPQIEREA